MRLNSDAESTEDTDKDCVDNVVSSHATFLCNANSSGTKIKCVWCDNFRCNGTHVCSKTWCAQQSKKHERGMSSVSCELMPEHVMQCPSRPPRLCQNPFVPKRKPVSMSMPVAVSSPGSSPNCDLVTGTGTPCHRSEPCCFQKPTERTDVDVWGGPLASKSVKRLSAVGSAVSKTK